MNLQKAYPEELEESLILKTKHLQLILSNNIKTLLSKFAG